ncbi:hypothetical protein D3C83_175720 [compost metagenome]
MYGTNISAIEPRYITMRSRSPSAWRSKDTISPTRRSIRKWNAHLFQRTSPP